MKEPVTYDSLKALHRQSRGTIPDALSLRIHRALSWLKRANLEPDDHDARFLFLWIGFNAAYALPNEDRKQFPETRQFLTFIERLVRLDRDGLLYEILWDSLPGPLRLLLDNPHAFRPYWQYCQGLISEQDWQQAFNRSRAASNRALGNMDTRKALAILFDRLYVIRNQLVHGGSTWNSSINRDTLQHACALLERLLPATLLIMMQNPHQSWGRVAWPVEPDSS